MIEILIAISIVAILSSIAIVVLSGALSNSRDQQRMRDLQSIKQALELYRNDIHAYPDTLQVNCNTNVRIFSDTKEYLNEAIKDPFCSSRSYLYTALPSSCSGLSCKSFVLCAALEGGASVNMPSSCSGLSCGTENCNSGLAAD